MSHKHFLHGTASYAVYVSCSLHLGYLMFVIPLKAASEIKGKDKRGRHYSGTVISEIVRSADVTNLLGDRSCCLATAHPRLEPPYFVLITSEIRLVFHPSNPSVIRMCKGGLSCYLKNKVLILRITTVFLSELLWMPQVRR